ncbi:SGNH/GDSL hydrolase family protein [Helicobacter trogontum]|nr:SGNH/GDSL hydrolase family protein [Helicobacter trogontum]
MKRIKVLLFAILQGKLGILLLSIIWIIISLLITKFDRTAKMLFGFSIMSFIWISILLLLLFIYCAIRAKSQSTKIILSYLSILPICIIIGEAYSFYNLQNKDIDTKNCNVKSSGIYATDYYIPNEVTGYRAKPNIIATARMINQKDDSVIYDISYDINEFGWRKTQSSNDNSRQCFLFFGDSFTIGEGLNNNESLPFYFGQQVDMKIYNFGFHGYGPHQALALLLSGEVKRTIKDCDEVIALYESLPRHISRANGFSPWEIGTKAPRFKINGEKLEWLDTTTNKKSKFARSIEHRLEQSYLYKFLQSRDTYKYDEKYNNLYFAIMLEMQKELKTQLNAPLYVLLWDSNNLSDELEVQESNAITQWLETTFNNDIATMGGGYMLASNILQNYKIARENYSINKCEQHPNAIANKELAKFLALNLKDSIIQTNRIKAVKTTDSKTEKIQK